jgi:hypothetical protein
MLLQTAMLPDGNCQEGNAADNPLPSLVIVFPQTTLDV